MKYPKYSAKSLRMRAKYEKEIRSSLEELNRRYNEQKESGDTRYIKFIQSDIKRFNKLSGSTAKDKYSFRKSASNAMYRKLRSSLRKALNYEYGTESGRDRIDDKRLKTFNSQGYTNIDSVQFNKFTKIMNSNLMRELMLEQALDSDQVLQQLNHDKYADNSFLDAYNAMIELFGEDFEDDFDYETASAYVLSFKRAIEKGMSSDEIVDLYNKALNYDFDEEFEIYGGIQLKGRFDVNAVSTDLDDFLFAFRDIEDLDEYTDRERLSKEAIIYKYVR